MSLITTIVRELRQNNFITKKISFNQYLSEKRMPGDECAVCQEMYIDPRLMPCGHSFCQECIEGAADRDRTVTCPICSGIFVIPYGGFTRGFALQAQQQLAGVPQQNRRIAKVIPRQQPQRIHIQADLQMYTNTRRNLRHVCTRMMDDSQHVLRTVILIASLWVLAFSRCIAGAVKLSSDCQMERDIAVYLFVKSWLGLPHWSFVLCLVLTKKLDRVLRNLFYEIYQVAIALLGVTVLMLGTMLVFGCQQEIREKCPLEAGTNSWTAHFINFAIFLIVLDWAFVTFFLFYFKYILFDDDNDDGVDV